MRRILTVWAWTVSPPFAVALVLGSMFRLEAATLDGADEPKKMTVVRAAINSFAYSRDGRSIFVGDALGELASYDVSTGRRTDLHQIPVPRGQIGSIDSLAVSPDGKSVAFAWSLYLDEGLVRGETKKSSIALWNISDRRVRFESDADKMVVDSLSFSPDGHVLACAMGGVTSLREVTTGRETAQLVDPAPPGKSTLVRDLRFSADGRYLGIREAYFRAEEDPAITGGQLVVRDAAGRRVLFRVPIDGGDPMGLAFAPDGRSMACGRYDVDGNEASVLHLSSTDGRLLKRFDGPRFSVAAVAFSPDGTLLVGGGGDGSLWIWSLPEGRRIAGPESLRKRISGIAFSPDGQFLAVSASNASIPMRPNEVDFKLWIYPVRDFRRSDPQKKN